MSAFSSSSSLHFFTQKATFSVVEQISLTSNNTHFNFKLHNSIKPIKSKPHFPISSFLSSFNRVSIHFSPSAMSNGAEILQVNGEFAFSNPHFSISPNFSSVNRSSIHFSGSALSDGAEVALSAEEEIEEDEEEEEGESVEKEGGGGADDEPQSVEDGRLYVGNLPFSMTPSQLSEIFAEAGKVANVEVCCFELLYFFKKFNCIGMCYSSSEIVSLQVRS